MKTNKKNIILLYVIGLLITGIISYFNLFENLGNYFYDDYLTKNLNSQKVNKDIVIIGVDRETIKYFGERSNWTRSRYEGLLNELLTQNPKVILFDYFFSSKTIPENFDWDLYQKITNSSNENIDIIFDNYQNSIYDKNYISKIDSDFGDLIKKAKNVVIPYSYKVDKNGVKSKDYNIYPIDVIAKNANLGYVNIDNSKDGVIRYRTQNLNDSKSISHIASEIYLEKRIGIEKKFYINYFSAPYDKYTSIPFQNAYNGIFVDYKGNKIDLKNKIVLVGDYNEIFGDTYKTPVSKDAVSPGVEIIANEIQSIIEGKNITIFPIYIQIFILFILYTLIFVLLIYTKKIFSMIFLSLILPILSYFIVNEGIKNYYYFDFKNISFTILIVYICIFGYKLIKNYKEKLKIKKEFSRYMDKKLVENILNTDNKRSETQNVTTLFLDIEGFTDMSEKLTNKELVKITNKIFSSFNDVILKNNGTIDKYIGDSIMVFWGEDNNKNHAYLASKTALELKKSLEKINHDINQNINIRIGVNTGDVIIGSIGDENFSDYTIIGDNVNLASRLEGINKYYSTRLILSESTYNLVKDDFITRELDNIKVKGKTIGIRIYELLGEKNDNINKELIDNHNKAINLYYNKNFDEAIEYFNKNIIAFDDNTAKIFIQRITEYKKDKSYNDDMIYEFHNK